MAIALSDFWGTRQAVDYGEAWTTAAGNGKESFIVAWSDKTDARNALLSSLHSDTSSLTCVNVEIAGVGWDGTQAHPVSAKLLATYADSARSLGSTPNAPLSDWKEHWEGGGEALTVGKGFAWSDATATGVPVKKGDVSAVRMFSSATITLTGRASFGSTGKTNVLNTIGKVNNATVTIHGFAYGAEHLLFLGIDAEQGTNTAGTGSDVYDLTFKFAEKEEHSWNEFWQEDEGKFTFLMRIDDTNVGVYETANFSDIDPAHWT